MGHVPAPQPSHLVQVAWRLGRIVPLVWCFWGVMSRDRVYARLSWAALPCGWIIEHGSLPFLPFLAPSFFLQLALGSTLAAASLAHSEHNVPGGRRGPTVDCAVPCTVRRGLSAN